MYVIRKAAAMFGWLRGRRKQAEPERAIYQFYDGVRVRHEDPMELHGRIEGDEILTDWRAAMKRALEGELEGTQEIVDLVRRAFRIPAYDATTGAGLTMAEVMVLFNDWLRWAYVQKKSAFWLPMPSRLLEKPPLPDPLTTQPDSACSSMPNELDSGEPIPSFEQLTQRCQAASAGSGSTP